MTDVIEAPEDLEVVLDDLPKTEPDVEVVKADEKPDKPIIKPEEGIEELKQKLEAHRLQSEQDRQARLDAENRANQQAQERLRAQTSQQDTEIQLVTNAVETVKQSTEMLKAKLAEAYGVQDFNVVADLQVQIADNAARKQTLENGLEQLKTRPKPEIQRQQPIIDPVEMLASQLEPRSAAWVRAHPQYARDPQLNGQMLAAHNLAVARGRAPNSDEYFSEVENLLGIAPQRQADPDDIPLRAAPQAAPVTRNGSGTGSTPNRVRLSAQEREVAEMMFPDDKDPYRAYAMNKIALQKEGKMQ